MRWEVILQSLPYLLDGVRATLLLSATVLVTGTVLGLTWGLLRVFPVAALQRFMTGVVEAVRSVPLLLQMFFIFFGLPALGIQTPVFLSAVLAMTLTLRTVVDEPKVYSPPEWQKLTPEQCEQKLDDEERKRRASGRGPSRRRLPEDSAEQKRG